MCVSFGPPVAPVQPDGETGGGCGRRGRHQVPPVFRQSGLAQIDAMHCGTAETRAACWETDWNTHRNTVNPSLHTSPISYTAIQSPGTFLCVCMEFAKKQYYLPCKTLISLSHRDLFGAGNNMCGAIIYTVGAGTEGSSTTTSYSSCKPKWHKWEWEGTFSLRLLKDNFRVLQPRLYFHVFMSERQLEI